MRDDSSPRLRAWRFSLAKVVPSVYAYLASRDGVDSPPTEADDARGGLMMRPEQLLLG